LRIREAYVNGITKISLPDLVILELANTIRYKKNSTVKDIEDILDNFARLRLDIVVPTIRVDQKSRQAIL